MFNCVFVGAVVSVVRGCHLVVAYYTTANDELLTRKYNFKINSS